MNDTPDTPATHSALSAELVAFIESLDGESCTVDQLIERIGDRGFGLLLMVLAFPAALPVPAPGYATPFGIMMVILGTQLAMGRNAPSLPGFLGRRTIPFKLLRFAVKNGRLPLRAVEVLIRPRFGKLARNRAFLAGVGVVITLMACSMSLPIPLTNTAPSFVIFVLAAGILEEDGLFLLAGVLLAPIAAAIAGLALYTAITLGPEAVETTVKPMIKGWLGLG